LNKEIGLKTVGLTIEIPTVFCHSLNAVFKGVSSEIVPQLDTNFIAGRLGSISLKITPELYVLWDFFKGGSYL